MEITRRQFVRAVSGGGVAVAVIGLPACSTGESPTSAGGWERISFGFVSAYLYARAGEAALVDTGTAGGADEVERALEAIGLGWNDLSTVILTHSHGDHVGSLPEVMERAPDATAHAGAEDIPGITSPRPVEPVSDGDTIFGLTIVATPGHTPGHVSVLDPDGVLVAGDALTGSADGVAGPNPQFTGDLQVAERSVVKLAGFEYERIYFGHGEPVDEAGSDAVTELVSEG